MRTKSPEKSGKTELPEQVVKLLEEAYITTRFIGKESAEAFREEFRKENPLVYVVRLLLASIDDVQKKSSPVTSFTFRHAVMEEYLERAKELLEEKD